MPDWRCGAQDCGGHAVSSARCAAGTWFCGLRKPKKCQGHPHPSDRCEEEEGQKWDCHSRRCRGHKRQDESCDRGEWKCGREEPACAGHTDRDRACRDDLTYSSEDCDQKLSSSRKVGGASEGCATADQVRLVEVVEVVAHKNKKKRQPVVAQRRQYVNLDEKVHTGAPHPEYGRVVRLQARVEWVSGDRSRSLAGQPVYWYSEAMPDNKSGLKEEEGESFNAGTECRKGSKCKETSTDDDGWTDEVEFSLSLYGGDQFEIYATDDAGYKAGLCAGTYHVWKKFWYQLTEMETGAADGSVFKFNRQGFEKAFQDIYIEFEKHAEGAIAEYVSNVPEAQLYQTPKSYFLSQNQCPFKAHIMTVDWADSGVSTETIKDEVTTEEWNSEPVYYPLWRHGAGKHPWKVSAKYKYDEKLKPVRWRCGRVEPGCEGTARSHACAPKPGSKWRCGALGCPKGHSNSSEKCTGKKFICRRLEPPCGKHDATDQRCSDGTLWSCRAQYCDGHESKYVLCSSEGQDIPGSVVIEEKAHPDKLGHKAIKLYFSASRIKPSAKNPVKIILELRKPKPDFRLGVRMNNKHHVLLCVGAIRDVSQKDTWDKIQTHVAVHEIGHTLGLVNIPPAPANAHDWAAVAAPNHCQKNFDECVMHPTTYLQGVSTFHLENGKGCQDYLRRHNFVRANLESYWKD